MTRTAPDKIDRLPVLATKDTLMQWQDERSQFATCAAQRGAPRTLVALCPHAQEIYAWAAGQLPHKNALPY